MKTYRTRLMMVGVFLLGAAGSALGITLVRLGASPRAHAQTGCDLTTFSGTYGGLIQGVHLTGPDGAPLAVPVPAAAVTVLVADGAGTITRTGTVNVGGMVSPTPGTATYTVNSDCSFTVTFGATAHFAGVLVDGGNKVFLTRTDPTDTVAIIWERE